MGTTIGEYNYKLSVDASDYTSKMNVSATTMKSFDKQLESSMTLLKTGLTAALATAGIAVEKFCSDAVNQFSEFEKKMNEVFTLLPDLSQSSKDLLTEQAKEFAEQYGLEINSVVSGIYQAISAGQSYDNVFEFLETSVQAAKGGVTDLLTSVDGLTSVVNSYGADVIGVAEASDKMFTTVKLGKTTFGELASQLSSVVPLASASRISFSDVSAAIATMTAQGVNTAETTTQLKQMFSELTDANSEVGTLFKNISGYSFNEFIAQGNNTSQALLLLEEYAKSSNVQVNQLFGSIQAGQAALALTGNSAVTFANDIELMNNSTGATQEAFETMENGVADTLDKISAKMTNQILDIGEKLEPLVLNGAEAVSSGLDLINNAMESTQVKIVATSATAITLYKAFQQLQKTELVSNALKTLKTSIAGIQASMIMAKEAELGFAATAKIAAGAIAEQTAAFLATPVGAITAITVALMAMYEIYDLIVTTSDEYTEIFETSSNELSEIQNNISNLNSELETTKERIDELQSKGTLTVVEQNELQKLQETNLELEKQIALQEKQQKLKSATVSTDFANAVRAYADDKGNQWYDYILQWFFPNRLNSFSNSENFEQNLQSYKEYQEKYKAALDEGNLEEAEIYQKRMEISDAAMSEYVSTQQGYINSLDGLSYDLLSDDAKELYDYILDCQDKYMSETMNDTDTIQTLFSTIFNRDKYSEAHQALSEFGNTGELTADKIEELYNSNDNVKAMLDYMDELGLIDLSDTNKAFSELSIQLNNVSDNTESASTETVRTAEEITAAIENAQTAYKNLSTVVDSYNSKGYITIDNLQALSDSGYEYTTYLSYENGQLKINQDAYKKLIETQIDELEIKQILQATSDLQSLTDEATAKEYLAQVTNELSEAEMSAAEAAFKMQLAINLSKGGNIAEASQSIADSLNNFIALCEASKSSISNYSDEIEGVSTSTSSATSSTDKFTDSLNAEKEALENSKSALEDKKSALEETKQGYEDAVNSIQDLIDWTEKYIKQTKENEISALEEKKSAIDDLIDKQKELLEAEKNEYDWNKEISDKQNTVAGNTLSAAVASLDDSSAGKKSLKQANDALIESQSDIKDTLYKREIEIREQALDELQEKSDEYYDKQIDSINEFLNDEVALYKAACSMIDNDNGTLYSNLLNYCKTYTTTTEAEFNHMWTSAQSAMQQYNIANLDTFSLLNDLQSRIYEVDTAIDTVASGIQSYEDKISGVQSELNNLSNSAQTAISNINAALNANGKLNELNQPKWYYKWQGDTYESVLDDKNAAIQDILNQIDDKNKYGGVFPASAATIYGTIKHYANGTLNAAGGLSLVGENGAEMRVLNKGDGILPSNITSTLLGFARNPIGFLNDLSGNTVTNNTNSIAPAININIQGDATQSTVKALQQEANKIVDMAVKKTMNTALKYSNNPRK